MAQMPYPQTDQVTAAEEAHRRAQDEATQAAQAVTRLRAQVEAGGDIEPAALTEAHARAEHAELRVEAAHRRVAQARIVARTAALAGIAQEVRQYNADGRVEAITAAVDSLQAAINGLLDLTDEHSNHVAEWHGRAGALLAEPGSGGFLPPSDQVGVATYQRPGAPKAVQADGLVLAAFDPGQLLSSIRSALDLPMGVSRVDLSQLKGELGALLKKTLHPSTPRATTKIGPAHFRDDA